MIYLASASPRRRELLQQIEIEFELLRVEVDETPIAGESAEQYVSRVAQLKAAAAVPLASRDKPILAADTSVIYRDIIMGKPVDQQHAAQMLRQLSGTTHQVKTAICVVYRQQFYQQLVTTDVTFRAIRDDEIAAYWRTGEPVDKAGGYGIQGRGAKFVKSIHGSYSAVVGLPLMETEQLLQTLF